MTFLAPRKGLNGTFHIGGDKSVSHRLILLALHHHGSFLIENPGRGEDVKTSLAIFRKLGGRVEYLEEDKIRLIGPDSFSSQDLTELDCANSGTTARLLCGLLAGCEGNFRLFGDESLEKRPMQRVIEPLTMMGANFQSTAGFLPLTIKGKSGLTPVHYLNRQTSAQVKSAILFAAMAATGTTCYQEPFASRNHSENILKFLGAPIDAQPKRITMRGPFTSSGDYFFSIPGDVSSAAFLVVAAIILEDSKICISNVLLNKTRTAFLQKLKTMGAAVSWKVNRNDFEPCGCIFAETSRNLRAISINANEVASLIDELPALAVAMAFADGTSTLSGASELRIKESDRIRSICREFTKAGVKIEEAVDGFSITGPNQIHGGIIADCDEDHRIAASLAIMAMASHEGFSIRKLGCIRISFPEFFSLFPE